MRRSYSGNARATTLTGGISAVATSFTVSDGTGYPTGAAGPFVVTLDAGNAAEEKILITSRTGNTMAVTSRGWDGTTASDHDNAASVQHTISATDLDEANALVSGGGTITASGAAVIPLTVKGASGQTTNLLDVRKDDDTRPVVVDFLYRVGIAPSRDLGTGGIPQDAGLYVEPRASGAFGLVVRGLAGQSGNLAQFEDSAGTALFAVTSVGQINIKATGSANNTTYTSEAQTAGIGTYSGIRVAVVFNGTTYYLPMYT